MKDIKKPVIYVYYSVLCTLAHSLDEVAYAYAHELGHLVLDHHVGPDLSKQCYQVCGTADNDNDTWWSCCDPIVAPTVNPQEDAADRYAFNLLSKRESPFKAAAGTASMQHVQDWRWATGNDNGPGSPKHAPAVQRAETFRQWERERLQKVQEAIDATPKAFPE
ncbi:MAG TPA: hypothetical protein VMU54_09335, partial [Planctomycetota bacterium]|nr:hypothetical protein [Planctomycetota bacterium]